MSSMIKLANRVVRFLCRSQFLEEIEGDLHEFLQRREPGFRTNWLFWLQVFNLLRGELIKSPIVFSGGLSPSLLRLNLLFALRNFGRKPLYALLNVMGITIGLTSSTFIGLYVLDELSFDQHWEGKENIYRVYVDIDFGTTQARYANATAPMAEIFENELDEILQSARWINSPNLTFRHEEDLIEESKVIYADQDVLELFSMTAIHGTINDALTQPNTLVLTQSTARKYFGDRNPVGNTLTTNTGAGFKITCVIEDIPRNSHFEASMLRTTINDPWSDPSKVTLLAYWTASPYRTYLKLSPGVDPKLVEEKFEAIYSKYFDPVTLQFSGQTWAEFKADGNKYNYRLQPLEEVYLYSDFQNDGLSVGDIRSVTMFGIIGIFILGMAYINFINLTTARATQRHKEIGIKKAMGSTRQQLIHQLLTESLLISVFALFLSITLSYALFPFFQELSEKSLTDPFFNGHKLWLILPVLTFSMGILSGFFPAFVLSRIPNISALRQRVGLPHSNQKWNDRKTLIVLQYAIVVFMVFGTVVVWHQMNFLQNKNLGYSRDNILVINNAGVAEDKFEALQNEIQQFHEVEHLSAPRHVPGDLYFFGGMMFESDRNTQEGRINCKRLWVDSAMIETMDLTLLQGRGFYMDSPNDSMSVIINETAIRSLGLGPDPIGKSISFTDGKEESFKVIGIVNDFHVRSLKSEMFAIALHMAQNPSRFVVKYRTEDLVPFLDKLQSSWERHVDDHVMNFQFGTDRYDRFYQTEARMKAVFNVFMIIALVIASMGLIGLAVLISLERRKEMGIRRILGATIKNLIWSIGQNLTLPVAMAVIIGLPLGYIAMGRWLDTFAYRIDLGWPLVIATTVFTLSIAWIVVGSLIYRSVSTNPVESLRDE